MVYFQRALYKTTSWTIDIFPPYPHWEVKGFHSSPYNTFKMLLLIAWHFQRYWMGGQTSTLTIGCDWWTPKMSKRDHNGLISQMLSYILYNKLKSTQIYFSCFGWRSGIYPTGFTKIKAHSSVHTIYNWNVRNVRYRKNNSCQKSNE